MTDSVLQVTSPDDMVAILQRRTAQLALGLQQGAHPQHIKDHIVSMYQVADILLEAYNRRQAENGADEQQEEAKQEEPRH